MKHTTGTGTIYQSKHLTRHYAGALGSVVIGAVLLAIVAVVAFPSLLRVFQ